MRASDITATVPERHRAPARVSDEVGGFANNETGGGPNRRKGDRPGAFHIAGIE
jgi:hypothetical protein